MDPTNTIGLVSAIGAAYDTGLVEYSEYSRLIWRSNTNHSFPGRDDSHARPLSALKATLEISPQRIRDIYDRAFILVGPEFSKGDDRSRDALTLALANLRTTLAPLSTALTFRPSRPRSPPPILDLHSMTMTSTSILAFIVTTLAHQYERQALSRPIPVTLPGVKVAHSRNPARHSATLDMLEEGNENVSPGPDVEEEDMCSISPADAISQVGTRREIENESQQQEGGHAELPRPREYRASVIGGMRRQDMEGVGRGGGLTNWRNWAQGDAEANESKEQYPMLLVREEMRNTALLQDVSRFRRRSKPRSWTTDPPSPPATPPNTQIDDGSDCMSRGGMKSIVEEPEEREQEEQSSRPSIRIAKPYDTDDSNDQEHEYAPPLSPLSPLSPTRLGNSLRRPKNSVFSLFCPVALSLQVDSTKAMPTDAKCQQCSYSFGLVSLGGETAPKQPLISPKISAFLQTSHVYINGQGHDSGRRTGSMSSASSDGSSNLGEMKLKEGFRLTARFLAKSHCESGRGFGCVLCTGSGWTDGYASAEELRDHINASHTKWQMLHDVDMK